MHRDHRKQSDIPKFYLFSLSAFCIVNPVFFPYKLFRSTSYRVSFFSKDIDCKCKGSRWKHGNHLSVKRVRSASFLTQQTKNRLNSDFIFIFIFIFFCLGFFFFFQMTHRLLFFLYVTSTCINVFTSFIQ